MDCKAVLCGQSLGAPCCPRSSAAAAPPQKPPLACALGTIQASRLCSSFNVRGGALSRLTGFESRGKRGVVARKPHRPTASVLSETSAPEQLKQALQGIEVLDPAGASVQLESLWKDRTAVVAFARHFGCVLCRRRADLLASKKAELDAAGVALVLIGPGSPSQAKAFVDQANFPGEVYADPSRSTYDAFKFVYGVASTFSPKSALSIINAYREGYRQDWELSFEEDTRNKGGWQNGGVAVIGPGTDRLLFLHKDKEAGDEPDLSDVVKACCARENNID